MLGVEGRSETVMVVVIDTRDLFDGRKEMLDPLRRHKLTPVRRSSKLSIRYSEIVTRNGSNL